MVSFQKGHMDPSGNYTGASYGCGLASVFFLLGIFATALLIGWPFVVFHGAVAWLVEILYMIVAIPVGLGLLAKRAGSGQREREKP